MNKNRKPTPEDLTLESLEAQLRSLPDVETPETLKTKLVAAIPDRQPKTSVEHRAMHHPRLWDFGLTAAAAILILALMLTANYGLSTPSRTLSAQLYDTSLWCPGLEQRYFQFDQNNALIEDTNYTKANYPW